MIFSSRLVAIVFPGAPVTSTFQSPIQKSNWRCSGAEQGDSGGAAAAGSRETPRRTATAMAPTVRRILPGAGTARLRLFPRVVDRPLHLPRRAVVGRLLPAPVERDRSDVL